MGEQGHWYGADGRLITQVPYAAPRAGFRAPTLRDARLGGLRPSVTTLLGLLDKPGLRVWGIKHAVHTALYTLRRYDETPDEHVKRVIAAHDEFAEEAADRGTQIHSLLARGLGNGHYSPDEPEAEIVDAFWPVYKDLGLVVERAEHSFVSPFGWAGTVDWLGTWRGQPAILDFKTQEFDDPKDANFYEEHALQLSGYALGTGNVDRKRLSLILSRNKPGVVAFHAWGAKDSELVPRYDRAFTALWNLWRILKNYDPASVSVEEQAEWLTQQTKAVQDQQNLTL